VFYNAWARLEKQGNETAYLNEHRPNLHMLNNITCVDYCTSLQINTSITAVLIKKGNYVS